MKKSRVNLNTNVKIYLKTLQNIIFSKNNKFYNIFLNQLKSYLNSENLILTSQGRVAIYNICKVITSNKKNEIIISPYTLTEVINAIIYAGSTPVYVDIDINTGLPNEIELKKKINDKTAGIILTHLFSNKKDILEFKEKFFGKIAIIEDVAINMGAKINNQTYLGTVFDYGFYSFGVMKNLCTFHGGAIYCKDKKKLIEIENNISKNISYPKHSSLKLVFFCMMIDLAYNNVIYNLFTHYLLKLSIKKLDVIMYPGIYPKILPKKPNHYNYKFQKGFSYSGFTNLNSLQKKINLRIIRVKLYQKYLNKDLHINKSKEYIENSYLEYPILLRKNKSRLLSQILLNAGYDIRHTWYVNSVRYKKLKYDLDEFPNCDQLHDKILSLPTHSKINEKDIMIISNLINYYEK